jgi:hypothetical protein
VDEGKRVQLRRLGAAYLKGFDERLRATIRVRFDVVSVYLLDGECGFEVLEEAFGWAEKTQDRAPRN